MDGSQFSTQIKCFKMIGIERDGLIKYRKLDKVLGVSRIGFMLFCIFSQSLFVVRNFRDIPASAEVCGPLLTTVLAVVKILTFTSSETKIYQMMDQVKSLSVEGKNYFPSLAMIYCYLFNISWKASTATSIKLKLINQFDKVIALAYLFTAFFTGIGYCATPIFMNLYYIMTLKHKFNFDMPLKAAFFYDVTKSPAYELSYFSLCCDSYIVNFISVSWALIENSVYFKLFL